MNSTTPIEDVIRAKVNKDWLRVTFEFFLDRLLIYLAFKDHSSSGTSDTGDIQ